MICEVGTAIEFSKIELKKRLGGIEGQNGREYKLLIGVFVA